MTPKPILAVAVASVLFGTFAFAQQPDTAPAPVPSPPSSDRIGSGRGQGKGLGQSPGRNMVFERHIVTEGGPHTGLRMGPPGIWWKNPDLIQKLTITPDQQKRMDDIFQQSRLQLIDLKANVERQEVILEPMLAANPPDTNKILAQIDKTAQARAELEKGNAKMLLGIRTVLTPDQWTKLQAEERGNRRFMIQRKGIPGAPIGPGNFEVHGGPLGPESLLTLPSLGSTFEIGESTSGPSDDIDF
jgi:Spy/CpxP family protein refolding chaperone